LQALLKITSWASCCIDFEEEILMLDGIVSFFFDIVFYKIGSLILSGIGIDKTRVKSKGFEFLISFFGLSVFILVIYLLIFIFNNLRAI
jgi:hypothetical protein